MNHRSPRCRAVLAVALLIGTAHAGRAAIPAPVDRVALAPCDSQSPQGAQFARLDTPHTLTLGEPEDGRVVRFGLRPTVGIPNRGGYGYLDCRLVLHDPVVAEHAARLEVRVGNRVADRSVVTHEFVLRRGEAYGARLPLPTIPAITSTVTLTVDGYEDILTLANQGLASGSQLLITDDAAWTKAWTFVPRALPKSVSSSVRRRAHRWTSRPKAEFATIERQPDQLPQHWQWLTTFSWIAVDGRVEGLDAARQQVLHDWLGGGGHLIVTHADSLRDGPLRELFGAELSAVAEDHGRQALGSWFASRRDPLVDGKPIAELATWLRAAAEPGRSSLPEPLRVRATIPSLGSPPLTLFLVLIFLFAIVVGPINYYWCVKRKRRPVYMVLTVPLIGFGFTVGILTWGILSEGFGTRGVLASITWLDQEQNLAERVTARTVYASSAPAELTPRPSTWLGTEALDSHVRAPMAMLNLALDGGRVRYSGSAIPARGEAALIAIENTSARERLRFERRANGYAVIADGEFRPVPGANNVLLRTEEGYFRATENGSLEPVADVESIPFEELLPGITERLDSILEPDPSRPSHTNRNVSWDSEWMRQRLLPPVGGYLAIVERIPSIDGLGLEVDYEHETHLVVGTLAEGDIDD